MRAIVIPDHAVPVGQDEWRFARVIRAVLDMDKRFNASGVGVRAAVRIERAMSAHDDGGELRLEDADWALLRDACEEPSDGYPIRPARLIAPIIEAVIAAKEST